jgi:uncharacterized protein YjbI with pentapeptide repeats
MAEDREPLEVVARVIGAGRPNPPPRRVVGDLQGGQFDRRSTEVVFEAVVVRDVSFDGMRFEELSVRDGGVFSGCDFSRMRSRHMSHLSSNLPRTVYRDCRFLGADLRHFSVGTARFERCILDGARLDGWRSNLAEFVDCHFAGRIRNVKFFGRANGPLAEVLGIEGRANEFRGNDFSQAELLDTSFVLGIDLDAQRWPEGPGYIRLNGLGERVQRARAKVVHWADLEARRDAMTMLELLQTAYVDQDQDNLFTHRATLGRAYGETAERVWDLLATASDRSRRS